MASNSDRPPIDFSHQTRSRDWDRLKKSQGNVLNVLIVGGGIVGAGIARECRLLGIPDVWLVEKNDFASGTSGASSKLIHAGLRYLEQSWIHLKAFRIKAALRNFLFVWEASLERKILSRLAPGLIWSKSIYLVLAEGDLRSPLSVAFGIWFYYLIQLLQGQYFSPPRVVFRKDAVRWIAPALRADRVKALFRFTDSETDDARLVLETLQWAQKNGARCLNYVELTRLRKAGDLWEADLKNRLNGETVRLRSKIVVNASGPYIDQVRRLAKPDVAEPLVDRVAGSHIDLVPAVCDESYYVTAKDGRLVFILRRDEDGMIYSRVGTTERTLAPAESIESLRLTPEEEAYLKDSLRTFLDDVRLTDSSVVRRDAGVRPLSVQESPSAFLKSREHRIVEEDGLYHLIGVKLTDFRRVAAEWTGHVPWNQYGIDPSPDGDRSATTPIRDPGPLYGGQSPADIIRSTMVVRWEDYVERRHGLAPLYWAEHQPETLRKVFDEMKEEMGWEEDDFN